MRELTEGDGKRRGDGRDPRPAGRGGAEPAPGRGARGSRGSGVPGADPPPDARPAAAVRTAAFLRVSHTFAIKESPKPQLSRAPPPPAAGEAIFHPLLVFNLLWGKKAAFVGRGAAQGAGRGRRRLCVPQLRARDRRGWGRPGGARGSRRAEVGRGAAARHGEGPRREGREVGGPGRAGAAGARGAGGQGRGG